jgi:hypothetical protein
LVDFDQQLGHCASNFSRTLWRRSLSDSPLIDNLPTVWGIWQSWMRHMLAQLNLRATWGKEKGNAIWVWVALYGMGNQEKWALVSYWVGGGSWHGQVCRAGHSFRSIAFRRGNRRGWSTGVSCLRFWAEVDQDNLSP